MADSVFERLENRLREQEVPFEILRHEPVYTSEEAARVRGTPLASGAKALICKVASQFMMFVLPADRRLANKAIRKRLGARKLRFASRDEQSFAPLLSRLVCKRRFDRLDFAIGQTVQPIHDAIDFSVYGLRLFGNSLLFDAPGIAGWLSE